MSRFQVAAVFSSDMVLQRQKNIRVFGTGEDGALVTVSLKKTGVYEGTPVTVTVTDGAWCAVLPPMDAGWDFCMEVRCGEACNVMERIAIGEVWLLGGQSNMEMELQNIAGGQELLQSEKTSNVRFYYTQKNSWMDEKFYEDEKRMVWKPFDAESARCWSGVGYLFGRELAACLPDIPIGLIGCNWGGTSASAWMSRDALMEDCELRSYVDEYEAGIAGKSVEEQAAEYDEYVAYTEVWQKKVDALYAENPSAEWEDVLRICGDSRWPGPMNCKNPFRPAGLYEAMIKRVCPYTLRGFLYYQGESDDHKPQMYRKLLTRLIQEWRMDWGDLTLPFLFVQLPMHRYKQDPDFKHWCLIREAQMQTYQTVRNTGLAVAIDSGEFNEIHPKDKRPVAKRLLLQALYWVYGKAAEEEAFGPMYRESIREDGGMRLRFDHAVDGFVVNGEQALGFEVAGEDKAFVPATEVRLDGDEIFVAAETVKEPCYVRYLWTNYGDVTVFGKNGIPLAPFRTSADDEQGAAKETKVEIRQIMEL